MKTLGTLFLILILTSSTLACDCKDLGPLENMRQVSYENADLVFLGELIESDWDKNQFTFKVIESYKGDVQSTAISGGYFDSCSKFPTELGQWIVYAHLREDGMINLSQCLATRSKEKPRCVNCYEIPGPPKNEKEKEDFDKEIAALEKQAKFDWMEEIEILRDKKK